MLENKSFPVRSKKFKFKPFWRKRFCALEMPLLLSSYYNHARNAIGTSEEKKTADGIEKLSFTEVACSSEFEAI